MLSQTRTLFGIPRRLDILAAFVFFSTLLTYNFSSEKIWRRYLGWACVLPLGFLFWFLPRPQQSLNLALGACWLLYYGLERPGQAGLRAFPLAKPVVISIVWAASTVLLPLPPEPDAVKRAVLRALDDAGQQAQATDWFIRTYDLTSLNGLRIVAQWYVHVVPWPPPLEVAYG